MGECSLLGRFDRVDSQVTIHVRLAVTTKEEIDHFSGRLV